LTDRIVAQNVAFQFDGALLSMTPSRSQSCVLTHIKTQ
jgi:hypothetical protein